jgi:hypothetical protein
MAATPTQLSTKGVSIAGNSDKKFTQLMSFTLEDEIKRLKRQLFDAGPGQGKFEKKSVKFNL